MVKPEEHLVVHFSDFVLAQKQLLNLGRSLERIRFDAGYLISAQIQFHQIRQTAEQTIGFDPIKLIIVE